MTGDNGRVRVSGNSSLHRSNNNKNGLNQLFQNFSNFTKGTQPPKKDLLKEKQLNFCKNGDICDVLTGSRPRPFLTAAHGCLEEEPHPQDEKEQNGASALCS